MRFWFKKGAWASKRGCEVIDHLDPRSIKSIAVIRHTALGDIVLTRPFFVEVKKAFPNAFVTISVLDHYMRGIPDDLVDRIHIVHRENKRNYSLKEKIKNLRELGYHDIIFDLADTSRSLLLCLLNKAQLKIGFPYRSVYRHLFYNATIFRSDFIFEADLLLHMLNLLGINDIRIKTHENFSPYIVYFTGASTKSKCWSLGNFKQLLLIMSEAYPNFDHIVLKGIGDSESIIEVFEGLDKKPNIKSADIKKLDETISFIKGSRMVISNDTGIRHLAIAVQSPTVGIFFGIKKGSTQPYRYWPRYGRHDIVYNLDGSEPSVEKTFKAAQRMMDLLQSANVKDDIHGR